MKVVVDLSLSLSIRGEEDLELGVEDYLFKILKTDVVISTFGGHFEGQSEQLKVENPNVALRIVQELF